MVDELDSGDKDNGDFNLLLENHRFSNSVGL